MCVVCDVCVCVCVCVCVGTDSSTVGAAQGSAIGGVQSGQPEGRYNNLCVCTASYIIV